MGYIKKNKLQIIMEAMYLGIMLPMFYSMINAVPASDDFAFGSRTISDNLLLDAVGYSAWNWLYHSGRWLIFFIQKLINPLNANIHLGRIYGICMICIFLLVFGLLRYSLDIIYTAIVPKEKFDTRILVFITITVLYTTYYYVEAYNWYIGATAYALPFGLLLLTVAYAIRYGDSGKNKYYIGMILAGLIPATNEFFDVPIGLLYMYVAYYVYRKKIKCKKDFIKITIPLVIYIICGISVVFAPGNFVRQDGYDIEPNLLIAVKQIGIDIFVRTKDILFHHPIAVAAFVVLFIIGTKVDIINGWTEVIIAFVLTVSSIFGTIFPYVYGRAMTTTYLDVRMQYLVDYMLLIGMCICSMRLGLVANGYGINKVFKAIKAFAITIISIYIIITGIYGQAYKKIVPFDIIRNRGLIAESYQFWNGVITEIEMNVDENVVITRKEAPIWSPYFLYMGIVEDDIYDARPEEIYANEKIMPNVYYEKNTITIRYLGE